jgi:hypothetical protein
MDLEQHRANRNHEDGKIDEKLHCLVRVVKDAKANAGVGAAVPGTHTELSKFNLLYFVQSRRGPLLG